MSWGHPARGKVVLFAGDSALVCLAAFFGTLLGRGEPTNIFRVYTGATLAFTFTFLSLLYIFDLYNLADLADGWRTLLRLCGACGVGTLVSSSFFYFLPVYRYGRSSFLLAVLLVVLLTYTWRRFYVHYRALFLPTIPTLVVGTERSGEAIRRLLEGGASPHQLVGFVRSCAEGTGIAVPAERVLGDTRRLAELVRQQRARCVVVACDGEAGELAGTLTRLKLEGVSVLDGATFYMQVAEELPVENLSHSWLWHANGFLLLQAKFVRKVKRLLDLLLATLALLLTLPITLLTAVAIKLDSPGPILIRQTRVGWRERPFPLLKFRSMRQDAESDGRAQWARVNDPRLTRAGRVIRRLHVDELPQMINILKGEMSFLGPRPERPEFVEQLKNSIPFYELRHSVPPGLTGWAQVKYPYGASVEDAKRKLQFDLYYILNASPIFDLRILLKTAQAVFFRHGNR